MNESNNRGATNKLSKYKYVITLVVKITLMLMQFLVPRLRHALEKNENKQEKPELPRIGLRKTTSLGIPPDLRRIWDRQTEP